MDSFIKMFKELYESYIGSKIVRGPWGGGNLFAINLSNLF